MQKSPAGDVICGRQTIVKEYPVLPSSLPNKIVVTGSRYDKLPGQSQQKTTWAFSKKKTGVRPYIRHKITWRMSNVRPDPKHSLTPSTLFLLNLTQ
jgi:hypothetical protein